jgi:arylsulfatase A-like enzyme|eukprot:COSAG02_NODE_166_length_31947_cov_34.168617_6_plen_70_part_00
MVCTELFEVLDLFPTLQELAGFEVSAFQEDVSQVSLFTFDDDAATSTPRTVALAQFSRCIAPDSELAAQ